MATVKNITPDTLSLFRPDAPPVFPGDEVAVPDEVFVKYAWPAETWEVITPPAGYVDASIDDAAIFMTAEPDVGSMTKAELVEHAAAAGIDLGDATTKAEILAAIKSTEA